MTAIRFFASRTRINRPVFATERRGAVLVLVAVSTFLLASILALSIDAGSLQHQRRMAQTAADAGALAGAQEIMRGRTFAIATSALGETQRNGFADGVGGDVVTVTYPSTTAPYTGVDFVTVSVERTASNYFAKLFGMATSVIRTHATAGVVDGDYCVIALNPTAANSLYLQNPQSQLAAPNCAVAVNSSSATGANVNGTLTTSSLGVSGSSVGGLNNITSPYVQYDVPPTPDPLAYLAMPTVPATCDHIQRTNADNIVGTVTLSPGTYCGGIVLKPGADVTLNQGLYILRGGGLDITGGGSTIRSSGSGVTFLNTAPPPVTEANYDPLYAWGTIHIQSATVTVTLSADTRTLSALTPFPGVLFYTDPAAPAGANVFKAGAVSTMNGTMYFPTQSVEFQSGTNFTIAGGLVADRVIVSQNVTITFTGASNGGGAFQALKDATVVD